MTISTSMNPLRRLAGFAAFGALAVALATGGAEAAPEKSKLKIGLPVIAGTFLPIYIGADDGPYKEEGLDVEIISFRGGSDLIKGMIAGSVDIGVTSLAGVNVGIKAKQPLKAFYSGFNMANFEWYAVPKIKSIKDVKGARFGISRYGSSTDFLTRFALTANGFDPKKDVQIIQGGRSSTRLAAMDAGQLDVNIFVSPESAIARERGYNLVLKQTDLHPDYPFHVMFAKEDFINDNPQTILALLRAHVRSVRIAKNDRTRALKVLTKRVKMDPKYAGETYDEFIGFLHEDGKLPSEKGMSAFWQMGIDSGTYEERWPTDRWWLSKYVDSYNEWKP